MKNSIKNKIIQDANGEELEFPNVDVDNSPDVGDEIIIDNERNLSGERLLPNGDIIKFEDGIVTEIVYQDDTMNRRVKPEKTIKCADGNKLEIFGNKNEAFKVDNRVEVNGKSNITGRFDLGRIKLSVVKGKIVKVDAVKASRAVFKKPPNKRDHGSK